MWVYLHPASCLAGGAATPERTVGADLPETGNSFVTERGGVTGWASHTPVLVVDDKVVLGELVGAQPMVGRLGSGFDSGSMAGFFQLGAYFSRSVGRVGDYLQTRVFVFQHFHSDRTVGCVGRSDVTGGDDPRVGFGGDVRFVTVPTLRPGFAGVPSLGVDHRDGPIGSHPMCDPPFPFPVGVGFCVLAYHHC